MQCDACGIPAAFCVPQSAHGPALLRRAPGLDGAALARSEFVGRRRAAANHRPVPPPAARQRRQTVRCVFDFLKRGKDGKDREKDGGGGGAKPAKGNVIDYVKRRAQQDIAKVNAFNQGLVKSREKLARDLTGVIANVNKPDADMEEIFEGLEEVLITSDLGLDTVDEVMEDLRREARRSTLKEEADVRATLKASLVRILQAKGRSANIELSETTPTVIVFVGANGMGKTTTIGKLATRYRRDGKKVLLGACDTFRAAAVEQLEEWARRAEVDIVKPREKQKSGASVAHDALRRAQEQKYDVVILDTSGRLHTNDSLMAELRKLISVVRKLKPDAPDQTLLVVDASIGRNAVQQATSFRDEIGVNGLAVTKLDGTARAGFVVSVVNELDLPVKLIGVGEKVDDLRDFDAEFFVEGLVG